MKGNRCSLRTSGRGTECPLPPLGLRCYGRQSEDHASSFWVHSTSPSRLESTCSEETALTVLLDIAMVACFIAPNWRAILCVCHCTKKRSMSSEWGMEEEVERSRGTEMNTECEINSVVAASPDTIEVYAPSHYDYRIWTTSILPFCPCNPRP